MRRLIAGSLVLLVLVVIVVIFYQNRHVVTSKIFPAQSPATTKANNGETAEKSKIFAAKIPAAPAKRSSGRIEPVRRAKPQTTPPGAGQSAAGTRPPVTEKQEQRLDVNNKATLQQAPRQPLTPSKKSIAGKRAASLRSARSDTAAAKSQDTPKTYARLNDSEIKLQALAWSADTSKRMAVINGRIVREGESLDGYQINQIRPEDVVVSDGRQLWRLEFGLQQ